MLPYHPDAFYHFYIIIWAHYLILSLLFENLEALEPFEKADRLLALKPFESLLLFDLVIRPSSSY